MHKRVGEYRLVRCDGGGQYGKRQRKERRNRKAGLIRRMLFQGGCVCLFSFVSVLISLRVLMPGVLTRVIAAEPVLAGNVADNETINKVNAMLAAQVERDFSVEPAASPTAGGTYAEKDRCDILIALDAGHGGEDEGCSREKILEKDINLGIVKAAAKRLEESGYQVMFTRETDTDVALQERADMANAAGADIFVSIHQNSCEKKTSDSAGIETWYNEDKADDGSRQLARLLHSDLLLYSGAKDRGLIADKSLYVIRETRMPACLVETGFLSNREEREKLTTEEYQDRLAEAIVSGIDLYFFPKTMYLTFDDGPTAENTAEVLDILKARNIKATFFLIGESVEKYPEVARRIVEEGHTIGIHCYNHNYKKLYADVDSYIKDFEKAREVIFEVTGVEAKLFRFPGGSINNYNKKVYEDLIEELTESGYVYYDWNASLEDASKNNAPETLLKNAKDSTLGRRRIVMLAHDTVDNTVQCLEKLIEQFPEYRMLPLTEEVEPIRFK